MVERFNRVVSLKADNDCQFERMMGWQEGTVKSLRVNMQTEKMVEVLQRFVDISPRWLLFGSGFIFGDAMSGVVQKLAFLANLERYLPVMTDEERKEYEEAVTVQHYTDYATSRIAEWENRLNGLTV